MVRGNLPDDSAGPRACPAAGPAPARRRRDAAPARGTRAAAYPSHRSTAVRYKLSLRVRTRGRDEADPGRGGQAVAAITAGALLAGCQFAVVPPKKHAAASPAASLSNPYGYRWRTRPPC